MFLTGLTFFGASMLGCVQQQVRTYQTGHTDTHTHTHLCCVHSTTVLYVYMYIYIYSIHICLCVCTPLFFSLSLPQPPHLSPPLLGHTVQRGRAWQCLPLHDCVYGLYTLLYTRLHPGPHNWLTTASNVHGEHTHTHTHSPLFTYTHTRTFVHTVVYLLMLCSYFFPIQQRYVCPRPELYVAFWRVGTGTNWLGY